jgi:predicted lysophospholipase L1 biosynthesis ABC-type transport system permease subunit
VAVVNEAFARRAWPGENPIDHRVQFPSDSAHRWWTVVGVAGDARYDDLSKPPPAIVYLPARQATYANPWYVIRTAGAPRAAAKVLDAVMPEVDPAFGVSRSVTGSDMLAARLARPRAFAALLSALSAIALVLVATGLFGVLSAYVRERQREIAIRGALGATPRQLRARVLAEALGAGAAGLVCGVPLAFAGSRVLGALVTDVQPVDAATALIVAAVLTVVVAAAVYGPVLRATRIDARTALSAE